MSNIGVTGFKPAIGTQTVHGIEYNYIACRYDLYGTHTLLYLDAEGSPKIMRYQDYNVNGIENRPYETYELIPKSK